MTVPPPVSGTHQNIAPDVELGRDVRLSSFLNLYGCTIGDGTTIGAFVEIQRGAVVGSRCKVSSHSFVCEGVVIEDECFIGHGVMFTNDRYPRATNSDGSVKTSADWELTPTRVRRRASIGSNATILAGVEIGEGALVAAGAVVTHDVAPNTVVMGSPARVTGVAPLSPGVLPSEPGAGRSERVRFLDLSAQHRPLREELLSAWQRILDTTAFVSGEEVRSFEEEFAAACGVRHCVAVSNGTDALMLALQALGVGPGDKVVVPANSFIATAAAVTMVGAFPVFVDCQPDSANIDTEQAIAALHAGARGLIPVHLYGLPADMETLCAAAEETGGFVLEDAAQAHLATYRGKPVGGLGHAAAFSFYPGKNLGAPGEGGAVTTDNDATADLLRALRDHGQLEKYHSTVVGRNARMTELTAATLRIKLRHLESWNDARRRIADHYRERLVELPGVVMQAQPPWALSTHHLFVVQVPDRDRVRAALEADGIETGLHYPVPIHLQQAYAGHGHGPGDFPHAERWASHGLSLPMYAELSDTDVDRVCDALTQALAGRSRE